jgi:hypothetical protein
VKQKSEFWTVKRYNIYADWKISLIAQRFQLSGYHHYKKAIRKICLSMAGWLHRGKLSFTFNKTPAMTKLLFSSAASTTDNAPEEPTNVQDILK